MGLKTEGQNHQFINLLMFVIPATAIKALLTLLPTIGIPTELQKVAYSLPASAKPINLLGTRGGILGDSLRITSSTQ